MTGRQRNTTQFVSDVIKVAIVEALELIASAVIMTLCVKGFGKSIELILSDHYFETTQVFEKGVRDMNLISRMDWRPLRPMNEVFVAEIKALSVIITPSTVRYNDFVNISLIL